MFTKVWNPRRNIVDRQKKLKGQTFISWQEGENMEEDKGKQLNEEELEGVTGGVSRQSHRTRVSKENNINVNATVDVTIDVTVNHSVLNTKNVTIPEYSLSMNGDINL